MKLCKHEPYKQIDWIKEPKYSTKEILIDVEAVKDDEHIVIRFAYPAPQKEYGWFYMSGKMIRRHHTQPNGDIWVYVVPLSKREEFIPIKDCNHII